MDKKTVVIALGGNALQKDSEAPTFTNERENIKQACKNIADLIEAGYKVVVTHGNGPQVGRMLIQQSAANSEQTPEQPFDVVDAMTQATIGYGIAQELKNELQQRNIKKEIASIITQVIVSQDDPGFKDPTKPVGPFFTQEQAATKSYVTKEDSGRGYRRVVASPMPLEIIEIDTIKKLVAEDNIVICCGGGGIPVFKIEDKIVGTAAVIDKDRVSNLLAQNLNAGYLMILTAVDTVCINFGQTDQESIYQMDEEMTLTYIEQGQFAPGSMLPKVQSGLDFAVNTGNTAIITSLDNAILALEKDTIGTKIKK